MQNESITATIATSGIHDIVPNGKDTMAVLYSPPLAASSVPPSHAPLVSNIPRYQPQPRASPSLHAIWSLPQSIHNSRRATDEIPQKLITSCGGNLSLSETPEATAAFTSIRDVKNPTYPSLAIEKPTINDPEANQKASFRFQQHQLHRGEHQQPNNQNSTFLPTSTVLPSIRKRLFEAIGSTGLSLQDQQRNIRHQYFSNVSTRDQQAQTAPVTANPPFSDSRVKEGSRTHQNPFIIQESLGSHLEHFVQASERGGHGELSEVLQDQSQEENPTRTQLLPIEHLLVQQRNDISHRHTQYPRKTEQKQLAYYQRPQHNQYQRIAPQEKKQYCNWNQPELYQTECSQQRRQFSYHHHDIYLQNQSRHVQPISGTFNPLSFIQKQVNIPPQQSLNQSLQMSSSPQKHYKKDSHTDNEVHPVSHHTKMLSHPNILQNSQIHYKMGQFEELKPILRSNLLPTTTLHPNLGSNQPKVLQGKVAEEYGNKYARASTAMDNRGIHSDSRDVEYKSVNVEDIPDLLYTSEAIETMPYTCVQCAARFKDRKQREVHIQMVHPKTYTCDKCKSTFTRKFDLEKHSATVHERLRPYACDQCHSSFGQKHHLVRHKKAIHIKTREFACDICDAAFSRKEHLVNHKRAVHDKSKPFLCSLCDIQYCEKRALRRHLEQVHSVKSSRSAAFAAWQPSSKSLPPSIVEILQL